MTSLGRGRGWGSSQNKETVLRRPGTSILAKGIDCSSLLRTINLIESDGTLKQRISDARTFINGIEKKNLKDVIEKLYKHSVNDRDFGHKVLMLFNDDAFKAITDDEGHSTRYHLFFYMQRDYDRRIELREENLVQFRNAVFLLAKVNNCLKSSLCQNAFRVLDKPLLVYMEMLLETASVEDLELLAQQITMHGESLYTKYKMDLDKLMISVRQVLVTRNLTPVARAMLMYILDLNNLRSSVLPTELHTFYATQLGNSSFVLMPPSEVDLMINVTAKAENSNEETVKTEIPEARNYPAPSNNAVPRAIRGSGAVDAGRDPKTQGKSRSGTSVHKQNSINKGWGHDDRFERDYDYD